MSSALGLMKFFHKRPQPHIRHAHGRAWTEELSFAQKLLWRCARQQNSCGGGCRVLARGFSKLDECSTNSCNHLAINRSTWVHIKYGKLAQGPASGHQQNRFLKGSVLIGHSDY